MTIRQQFPEMQIREKNVKLQEKIAFYQKYSCTYGVALRFKLHGFYKFHWLIGNLAQNINRTVIMNLCKTKEKILLRLMGIINLSIAQRMHSRFLFFR